MAEKTFKIATFNANSLRSRLQIVCDWLTAHPVDVLAIQETKCQNKDFPTKAFVDIGYHVTFKGQPKYNGVAIISREKPDHIELSLPQDPSDQARFIRADYHGITIVNTYIPQGREIGTEQFSYKLDWFGWLREYFDNSFTNSDPIIWLGDLNIAKESIDVHDPDSLWGSVCYCQDVQDALKHITDWGFTDLFRKYCTEPEQYTFWDYRVPNGFKRNIGWRLDYIMASEGIVDKSIGCVIDKEPRGLVKPSDHTFLVSEFML